MTLDDVEDTRSGSPASPPPVAASEAVGVTLRRALPPASLPPPLTPPRPSTPSLPPLPVESSLFAPSAAVDSSITYAGWWRRAGALLIDGLVIATAALVLARIFGAAVGGASGLIVTYLVFWVNYAVIAAVYAPVMLARKGARNGQTLGKQALGIRVRDVSGAPVLGGQAFLREVIMRQFLIGGIGGFFILPPILDALWPLWEPRNRALHDLGASTIVTLEAG